MNMGGGYVMNMGGRFWWAGVWAGTGCGGARNYLLGAWTQEGAGIAPLFTVSVVMGTSGAFG